MAVIRVQRVDAGTLRAPTKTAQGFLRVDGYVSRAGVYEYINTPEDEKLGLGKTGTTRRELRPEEEVFSQQRLDAMHGMPITIGHPPKKDLPLSPDNVKKFSVGTVMSKGTRDGDRVAAELLIQDGRAQARVDSGELRQLSPGYDCEIELKSGMHPVWGPYDVIQRNHEYNHMALVGRARGGSDLQMRLDEADIITKLYCDEQLSSDERDALRDSTFAVPEKRKLPLTDHDHVVAAMGGHGFGAVTDWDSAAQKRAAYHRIISAAKKYNIDSTGFEQKWGTRLDSLDETEAASRQKGSAMADQDNPEIKPDEQIRLLKTRCDEADTKLVEREGKLTAAQRRADEAEAKLTTATEQIVELTKRLEAGSSAMETEAIRKQATRADEAEVARDKAVQSIPELVAHRADVIVKAKTVMGSQFRTDGIDNREIVAVVVKHLAPKENVALEKDGGPSYAFLCARMDGLIEARTATARSYQRASEVLVDVGSGARQTRGDSAESTRETRAKEWRDQWKKPLPSSDMARKRQKEA